MADDAMEPRSLEDREHLVAELTERVTAIEAEWADRPMSDEARAEWNDINGQIDDQKAAADELRKRKERLRNLAGNPNATERATTEVPSFRRNRGEEIYDLTRIRAEARSEEDHRSKLHDNAKRAVEKARFPAHAGSRERASEHVEDLLSRCDDEHGSLAKRILATGSPVYDRAFGKLMLRGPMSLSSEEQRAMSVGTDSQGGFAVPFQLDPTVILTNDGSISPLRQIARVETITSKTWQGVTSSGITVTRSAEGAEAADNSFTVSQPEVSPKRVLADVRFSVEIQQDWAGLRSEISRLLLDAKDIEEDASFVTGDGTGNNPSGVVATLASSSVVDVAGAGTLTTSDLYGLEAELPVRHRARGRFLANKSTYQDVRDLGTGSDGGELWVRLASGQPNELLGYPAHEASAMSAIGTAANRFLMFGDFSEFLIVDRLGMTVEVNPHIVGSNGRWTGQRAVVAVWRNSSLILNDNAFRVLADVSGV